MISLVGDFCFVHYYFDYFSREIMDFIEFDSDGNLYSDLQLEDDMLKAYSQGVFINCLCFSPFFCNRFTWNCVVDVVFLF